MSTVTRAMGPTGKDGVWAPEWAQALSIVLYLRFSLPGQKELTVGA